MQDAENYIRMPIAELTTPTGGRLCVVNHWWAITENEEALFYRTYGSPQCNSDPRVMEKITQGRPIKTRNVFLPVAYVPHSCE